MYPKTMGKWFGPDGKPRQWFFINRTPADDVPWLEAPGMKTSGRVPKNYRVGVVMQAPVELPRHGDGLDRRIAAAYPLGDAVLGTELYTPADQEWVLNPTALFGVGKGPFRGMIGHMAFVAAGGRTFEPFADVQLLTPTPQPLEQLVQAYPAAVRV